MIVKCSDCDVSFSVDDKKINGKKFAFDCPNCKHHNIIDNRSGSPIVVADAVAVEKSKSSFTNELKLNNSASQPSDEFEFNDSSSFDDEIEPEFDLSLLNKSKPASSSFSSPDDLVSDEEPVAFGESGDDFNFDSLDLPEGLSSGSGIVEEESGSDDFEPVESENPDDFSKMDFSSSDNVSSEISSSDDDSTTIDLDSLDIDLDGLDELASGETLNAGTDIASDGGDDLTLDLNSLNINLEESDEIKNGENLEDDDRLSLEDAGLSLDELSGSAQSDEIISDDSEDELRLSIDEIPGLNVDELAVNEDTNDFNKTDDNEDELRLSIDEIPGLNVDELAVNEEISDFSKPDDNDDELRLSIDEIPGLNVDELAANAVEDTEEFEDFSAVDAMEFDELPDMPDDSKASDSFMLDEFSENDLPEVDFDKYEADTSAPKASSSLISPDVFDIDTEDFDEFIEDNYDHTGKGFINFSIDYSLKYSRLFAFLRLAGVYYVIYLPHFIVLTVYTMLSGIVGTLNWILVLFSGKGEKDFYAIQEKTLRYHLHLSASMCDIIEDNPKFAGNTGLDDSLQMKAALPENPSRFLAVMRLTGIGIIFISLPHIILFEILSFGMLLIWFIGLIAVIITGKWPNILFDFMVRYFRYAANVAAYISGLSDSYPSFRFD